MYEDYLLEKRDTIVKILDAKNWISSYQLFLQSIKMTSDENSETGDRFAQDKIIIGGSVRIRSHSFRSTEVSFAISELEKLNDLVEPKSTISPTKLKNFPNLKKPNTGSILGDFSGNINMKQTPAESILEEAREIADRYEMPFQHKINLVLEDRLVHNSGSINLIDNSLRSQYQIGTQFKIHNTNYFLERSTNSRSVSFDLEDTIVDLVQSAILRIKTRSQKIPEDPAVLFHPQALSKLLSNYFSEFLIDAKIGEQIWPENIQVYDDPIRSGGYYSFLFDDEGSITKPLQLISDGRISNVPSIQRPTNGILGGNAYRTSKFQPLLRSYKYEINPDISNLVLTGGTGKGKMFVDRPGDVLLVRKAYSFSRLSQHNYDFILHVNEAELFKNGESCGPVNNFTMVGNLQEIMRAGHFSSDQVVSVDPLSIGSFYTGWLIVPPSTVVLRS